MRFEDIDWREVLNGWTESDIEYLMCICQEKINELRIARMRGLLTSTR